jgi:hypothetical protein
MVSSHGEKLTALDDHCRRIVLELGPICLPRRLHDIAEAGCPKMTRPWREIVGTRRAGRGAS